MLVVTVLLVLILVFAIILYCITHVSSEYDRKINDEEQMRALKELEQKASSKVIDYKTN